MLTLGGLLCSHRIDLLPFVTERTIKKALSDLLSRLNGEDITKRVERYLSTVFNRNGQKQLFPAVLKNFAKSLFWLFRDGVLYHVETSPLTFPLNLVKTFHNTSFYRKPCDYLLVKRIMNKIMRWAYSY